MSRCRSVSLPVAVTSLSLLLFIIVITHPAQARQQQDPPLTDQLLGAIKSDPIYLTGIFQTFGDLNLANDLFEGGTPSMSVRQGWALAAGWRSTSPGGFSSGWNRIPIFSMPGSHGGHMSSFRSGRVPRNPR